MNAPAADHVHGVQILLNGRPVVRLPAVWAHACTATGAALPGVEPQSIRIEQRGDETWGVIDAWSDVSPAKVGVSEQRDEPPSVAIAIAATRDGDTIRIGPLA